MFIDEMKNCGESFYYDFDEYGNQIETDRVATREVEAKIYDDEMAENEVGYLELLEEYDNDGDCEWVYVAIIEIHEPFRNQGRGTKILRQLAEEYEKVYICPDNDDSARLYGRLGEKVGYNYIPETLLNFHDNWGKMFLIKA